MDYISLRIDHYNTTVVQRFFYKHIMLRLSKTSINFFQKNFYILLIHNSLYLYHIALKCSDYLRLHKNFAPKKPPPLLSSDEGGLYLGICSVILRPAG